MKIRTIIFSSFILLGLILYIHANEERRQTYGIPAAHAQEATARSVYLITLEEDTINPITADYIGHAIEKATLEGANCLILQLDTPGGLLSSTRSIVKKILAAKIPVVVYVAPSGARAGSAGVFITYASHVAAMAPSTNIGAAHPVQMGGGKDTKKKDFWDGFKELIKELEESEKKHSDSDEDHKTEKTDKDKTVDGEKSESDTEEDISGADKPSDQDQKPDESAQGDEEELEADEDAMSSKILQDTVAFIKALAKKRGRNESWAIKSVTKSSSITETEASELGVIEIIAEDVDDLLEQLDGRAVTIKKKEVVLATKGAVIKTVEMTTRERLLNILANPNIAYIFMILGFFGLLYEVTHPGIGVPGIVGLIFLILAYYSTQIIPTNYAGVALILLAIILFIAEAFTPTFGLLTLGGVTCMVLGSLILFEADIPAMRVSYDVILAVTLTTAGITIFLIRLAVIAHRRKVLGGKEGMIGERGKVQSDIPAQGEGKVYVHGEIWNATATEDLAKGDKVEVMEVDGMLLTVRKWQI